MTTETAISTGTCDSCKNEVPSQGMVYWLVEISNRPTVDRGDIAIGSPKYCKPCAFEMKLKLKALLKSEIRLVS